jgi:hypothetical protein
VKSYQTTEQDENVVFCDGFMGLLAICKQLPIPISDVLLSLETKCFSCLE